jgi:hypothetical protein
MQTSTTNTSRTEIPPLFIACPACQGESSLIDNPNVVAMGSRGGGKTAMQKCGFCFGERIIIDFEKLPRVVRLLAPGSIFAIEQPPTYDMTLGRMMALARPLDYLSIPSPAPQGTQAPGGRVFIIFAYSCTTCNGLKFVRKIKTEDELRESLKHDCKKGGCL